MLLDYLQAKVDSVLARFKNARVEKESLNIGMPWDAGTACLSEVCVSAFLRT